MGSDLPLSVLFVVPYAPTRVRSRSFHLIRALAAGGHRVTVATTWANLEQATAVARLRELDNVEDVIAEPVMAVRSLWNCVRAIPSADPLQAHHSWSPRLSRRVQQRVRESAFDVVHVEHLRGARYGLALRAALESDRVDRPALIWDAVDCISTLFRRASRESASRPVRLVARLELSRTERYEAETPRQFDRVLATSAADRRDLVALARAASDTGRRRPPVDVLTNGVDLSYFAPSEVPRSPATLVVTAKMSYHANATAVLWLAQEVMPLIWRHDPDVRLWLVGQDPPRSIVRLADATNGGASRIRVTGAVDDIRPFLREATVALAPIQYSVGVQNKVLEALASGTPLVATPQAVAALDVEPGLHVEVAPTARDMARVTLELLRDARRRSALASAGRAFVERRHDWSTIGRRLVDCYREAMRSLQYA